MRAFAYAGLGAGVIVISYVAAWGQSTGGAGGPKFEIADIHSSPAASGPRVSGRDQASSSCQAL